MTCSITISKTADNKPLLTSLFLRLSLPRGFQLLLSCDANEAFKTSGLASLLLTLPCVPDLQNRASRLSFVHARKSILRDCCEWAYLMLCVWVKNTCTQMLRMSV